MPLKLELVEELSKQEPVELLLKDKTKSEEPPKQDSMESEPLKPKPVDN